MLQIQNHFFYINFRLIGIFLIRQQTLADFKALEIKLNEMAKAGEKIDDLFIPVEHGTIKKGGFGFVYKGMKYEWN